MRIVGLHDPEIGRKRKLLGYVLSAIPSLGVFASGVSKFFPGDIHLLLAVLNLDNHAVAIGLVAMAVVLIYWIPRTVNLGFFLFLAYCGGILVGELVVGEVPLPALTIGAMVFAGTVLRKPSLLG